MKITKHETTLRARTVAVVAVVLLGGVWWSQHTVKAETAARQAQTAKVRKALRAAFVVDPAKAKAKAGRYRLIVDTKLNGKWTTISDRDADIELKPNGQWMMHTLVPPGRPPIGGTFNLTNTEIVFFSRFGSRTARLIKNGFTSGQALFSNSVFYKNHRYLKVSAASRFPSADAMLNTTSPPSNTRSAVRRSTKGNVSAGRYQLFYDRTIDGKLTPTAFPITYSDVELKPNGQWHFYQGLRLLRTGTYKIVGKKITFSGSPVGQSPRIRTHTARLTRDGFTMIDNPFNGYNPHKNIRYVRVR